MTDYITSDLRLCDPTAAKERGFTSVADHDHTVIKRIRSTAADGDRLFIIGDLTVSPDKTTLDTAAVLDNLTEAMNALRQTYSRIYLVLGDRDVAHPMHNRTSRRWWASYPHLASTVSDQSTLTIAGKTVLLNHLAYDDTEHPQWVLRDLGAPLLHGHTPGRSTVDTSTGSLQIDVSLDAWGGRPVSKDTVNDLIERYATPTVAGHKR